ncbi:MAG: TMEM175 family protein [Anaerolineae bacterium]|nr:TMEM175 family protein [Anaerolineae bacterium]
MLTGKTRLEAFSDAMFAIILTILVLELRVPELEGATFQVFAAAVRELAPKFISFAFSFFVIAILWVNPHRIIHQIEKVDSKLLWMNILLLFFTCLFPFLTAFVGDYPLNPFVVALYPINMALSSLSLRMLWKYAFVDTNLAPNTLTPEQKQQRLRRDLMAAGVNGIAALLAFVWTPITLLIIVAMPFLFVVPELLSPSAEN